MSVSITKPDATTVEVTRSTDRVVSTQLLQETVTVKAGVRGEPGPTGPQGAQGPTGATGPGVPSGGVAGDILSKVSSTNYDTAWTSTPAIDGLRFDTTTSDTLDVGRMTWNDTDGTLDLRLKGNNVTLQVGQETVHMCVNRTGADIPSGKVVRLYGASGQRVGIALAQANSEQSSSKSFGVTTEDIDDNHTGFITTEGFVRNIDTNALTEGAIIWLDPSTAGGMTTTKPSAPNHLVMIGVCVVQGNNGIIWVSVQNGYELEELHNVSISSPTSGQALVYNGTLWTNDSQTTHVRSNDIANIVTLTQAEYDALTPSATTMYLIV